MRFSVIIPTYRRVEPLSETLRSLERCSPPPDEVVVVDGDSHASVMPALEGLRLPLRYLHATGGVTIQRNRGIDAAVGDIVVFLDDDVRCDPRLFEQLAAVYEDPSVVGATGRVVEPVTRRIGGVGSSLRRRLLGGGREGTFTRFGYPRYLAPDTARSLDVEFMQGCFMSARREVAARVRFDEKLRRYALAEDEDFSYRLSRRGRIRYLPDAVVEHRKLGFNSQDPREFGRLVVVNRAYLFRKNFPQTRLARMQFGLLVLLLLGHRLVNREWRGAVGLVEGAVATARRRR